VSGSRLPISTDELRKPGLSAAAADGTDRSVALVDPRLHLLHRRVEPLPRLRLEKEKQATGRKVGTPYCLFRWLLPLPQVRGAFLGLNP